MSQYLRKYKLSFLIPWEAEENVLLGPPQSIFPSGSGGLSLTSADSSTTPLPERIAQLREAGTGTIKQLEEWRILRRENLAKRWEAFSQGGGEWGRDFEDGVGKFITIENLHIEFEIDTASNDLETGGDCEISIFNLSDSTVKFLRNYSARKVAVKLEAGYEESFGIIYNGIIEGLEDVFEDENRITTVVCTKGGPLKDININKYFSKGTPIENVLVDLAKETGLSVNFPSEYESLYTLSNDLYLVGNVQDTMKTVLESYDLVGSIGDFIINITTTYPTGLRKVFEPYVINDDTGLIGIPSALKDENTNSEAISSQASSQDSSTGIEFTCLLNPNLKVQDFILMDSTYYRGTYRLVEVKYEGSYEGSEWYCICKAEAIEDLTWEVATATNVSGE